MTASPKITTKGQITVPLHKPKNLMDYVGFLGNVGTPDDVEEAFTPEVIKSMLERE